jgi:hypothetical protein
MSKKTREQTTTRHKIKMGTQKRGNHVRGPKENRKRKVKILKWR